MHTANMATFVIHGHPVAILVTEFTNPDNLTNYQHFPTVYSIEAKC